MERLHRKFVRYENKFIPNGFAADGLKIEKQTQINITNEKQKQNNRISALRVAAQKLGWQFTARFSSDRSFALGKHIEKCDINFCNMGSLWCIKKNKMNNWDKCKKYAGNKILSSKKLYFVPFLLFLAALRVPSAEIRLTVYRRLEINRKNRGQRKSVFSKVNKLKSRKHFIISERISPK